MGKKVVYTKITPLPSNVPRQLALDMLHSHTEVIELNPLVTGVKTTTAPRDAHADEFFSNWYEISEIITWGFGIKKKINFKGVFHDQPWGLQAHVYAPMGVDLRNKYRVGGNQPGEPREARELGLETPQDGLYLREDHEITCSVPLTATFVKKEMKAATAIMVDRMTRKAELLGEGKLHAMFENGKLKTAKPNLLPTFSDRPVPSPLSEHGPSSPALSSVGSFGPPTDDQGFGRYSDIVGRQNSQRSSQYGHPPQHSHGTPQARPAEKLHNVPEIHEVEGSYYHPQQSPSAYQTVQFQPPQGQSFRAELPGDNTLNQPQQTPSDLRPASQYSQHSHNSQSYQPQHFSNSPQPSPRIPQQISNRNSGSQYLNAPHSPPIQHQNTSHVAEWQHNVSTSSASDPNSLPPSRHTSMADPDHDRLANLSLHNSSMQHSPATSYASTAPPPIPPRGGPGGMMKCPVCSSFEGDETAISHHVTQAHFK
ncbi:Hypothetical protein R9X50_00761000 [Acrodontium crateriforme]|uniref:DUF7053 domain-containing protein n=1 Tax=Acrodontium crateriforme TaxID=150365 RepID=A0AAQ3MBQ5_9PEZI|nr:Hypothetical protein R9X50_00761000 [Acrodontium crateriforme]